MCQAEQDKIDEQHKQIAELLYIIRDFTKALGNIIEAQSGVATEINERITTYKETYYGA